MLLGCSSPLDSPREVKRNLLQVTSCATCWNTCSQYVWDHRKHARYSTLLPIGTASLLLLWAPPFLPRLAERSTITQLLCETPRRLNWSTSRSWRRYRLCWTSRETSRSCNNRHLCPVCGTFQENLVHHSSQWVTPIGKLLGPLGPFLQIQCRDNG